jgi:hypothetical protein
MIRIRIDVLGVLSALITTVGGVAGGQKDLASCKPVFAAVDKAATTPNHVYATSDASGRSSTAEIIFVGGVTYVNTSGGWRRSPVTPRAMAEQETENRKNAKSFTCKHVRDEVVGGVPAAVYEGTSETEDTKTHNTLWVAKSSGLPLRNEMDMDVGGVGGKTHRTIRYEYSNVRAPAVVPR